jgi:hypothetical protein
MRTFLRRRSRLCLESLEARYLPSTVTNLSDHEPGSLRDAITSTPSGGTVDFQPGLTGNIVLTTGELAITKNLTIDGPGADLITVSGNKATRVFNIANFTVAISGLTIAHGAVTGDFGGGMGNIGTLTITGCSFSGNLATATANFGVTYVQGGGIYNAGTLTITSGTFSGNSAANFGGGGGIYNSRTLTVTGSTFSGNSASAGGGIYNSINGTLTINACTFSGNSASLAGGIYNEGTLTVTASTFSGNSANADFAGYGGGMSNAGTLTINACTFSGNSASGNHSGSGGGIDNGGTLTITGSTFSGNSANGGFYGGGIDNGGGFVRGGTLTITDSTFKGGGVYNSSGRPPGSFPPGTVSIRNTLLAGNSAQGSIKSQGHNLIGDGSGGTGYVASDLVGTSASPIDPKLGPLQDNGGPTWTMALLPGSPAIDAGGPSDSEWDQRGPGFPRLVNGMADIGAYEARPSGAGSAAFTLRFPEPPHIVPVLALCGPSAPSVPLRQADATVDRVFTSWSSNAATLILGRSRHAALVEQGLWRFVPICGVTQ